jgi:hypothetical protein
METDMFRLFFAAAACALLLSAPARAHGVAGAHMFISTLLIDDSNVADEASLPTFMWLPQSSGGNGPSPTASSATIEIDKRLTENFGFALSTGYQWLATPGQKTINGWQNLSATLKYKVYVNDEHEFMASVGVTRQFARTGANGTNGGALGNDDVGSTTPTLYASKGLGDLPIGPLRALAVTGTFGLSVPDRLLKYDFNGNANNGGSRQWQGGLSLQYSIRYLETQVQDHHLPAFVRNLTPVVEVAWSSPASRPNNGNTQYLFGAGINYTASTYAVTAEALFPGNSQSGSHPGFIVQFHLYFDDLFPNSLGKPVSQWF